MSAESSKRQRRHLEEERASAEAVPNYEPHGSMELAEAFVYHFEGESARRITLVPEAPGDTWESGKGRAARYYDALRRAEEWLDAEGIVEEHVRLDETAGWPAARAANNLIALLIQLNALRVYLARAEQDESELRHLEELREQLQLATHDELVDHLYDHMEGIAAAQAEEWAELESGPGSLPATAFELLRYRAENITAAAIRRADDEHAGSSREEWVKAFGEHLQALLDGEKGKGDALALYAERAARASLEAWQPASMPLEELRDSLLIDDLPAFLAGGPTKPEAGKASSLRLPTSPLVKHMTAHAGSGGLDLITDITVRERGKPVRLRARSSTNLQASLVSTTGELLERMHQSILSVKRHGAAVLKVQLDLMNQAYQAGGPTPLFYYDLNTALERQGYTERVSRRAYDSETLQSLRERVVTLAHQQIDVLNLTETDKKGRTVKYVDSTPYWVIEATRRRKEGDEVNAAVILLADPSAPVITGFTIRPGLWWQAANVGEFYLDIPASVLELPTHGQRNEPERLALLLTPLLAIWERASQKQHAGKSTKYGAGTLLAEAGYVTREEFLDLHPTQAKRVRDHLASTDDTGALPILNDLGAFTLDIVDDADFHASGRGWREKFWHSQVRLGIRDLQLPKAKGKRRRKR